MKKLGIGIIFLVVALLFAWVSLKIARAETEKPFSFRTSKEIYCFVWERSKQGRRGLTFMCSSSMLKLRKWLADDKEPDWNWLNDPSKSKLMGAYKLEKEKG